MAGESDLSTLLASMHPDLHAGRWVFVSVPDVPAAEREVPDAEAFAVIREDEGTTLIVEQGVADSHGLAYDYVAARITLRVHSALEAVGLTAAISGTLALAGLSCNVIAGYFHDHLFVPYDDGPRAVKLLEQMGAIQSTSA